MSETTTLTFQRGELATKLANVVLFAGKDRARPILTHVLFEVSTDEIRAVATDSYGLCFEVLDGEMKGAEGSWLVPAASVTELVKDQARLVGDQTTTLTFDRFTMMSEVAGTTRTAQLYEGEYPRYRSLFPTGEPTETTTVGWRVDQLARIGKVRDVRDPKNAQCGARWEMRGADKPTVVKVGTATILQMPFRMSS